MGDMNPCCLCLCSCHESESYDSHPELKLFFESPEGRARNAEFARKDAEYAAAQDEIMETWLRESVEWREQLIAQRDPIKCATPIDQDALTREQQKKVTMGADLERWLLSPKPAIKDDGSFILDGDGNPMQITGHRIERDPNDPDRVTIHFDLVKAPQIGEGTISIVIGDD